MQVSLFIFTLANYLLMIGTFLYFSQKIRVKNAFMQMICPMQRDELTIDQLE